MKSCPHEFKDENCFAKVCSSSDQCLAVIGKMQCDGFNKFSQEHPESAQIIVTTAEIIHQFGG